MPVSYCSCCGTSHDYRAGWTLAPKADRGNRNAYLCPDCAMKALAVDTVNTATRGKNIGGGYLYRVRLIVSDLDALARVELLSYDWIVKNGGDCYILDSPVYCNLKPIAKKAQTIERLYADGNISIKQCAIMCVHPDMVGLGKSAVLMLADISCLTYADGIAMAFEFTAAEKLMQALKLAKRTCGAVLNNYVSHMLEDNFNGAHKAKVVNGKIVKLLTAAA